MLTDADLLENRGIRPTAGNEKSNKVVPLDDGSNGAGGNSVSGIAADAGGADAGGADAGGADAGGADAGGADAGGANNSNGVNSKPVHHVRVIPSVKPGMRLPSTLLEHKVCTEYEMSTEERQNMIVFNIVNFRLRCYKRLSYRRFVNKMLKMFFWMLLMM